MKKLLVKISPDGGSVKVEADGFVGEGCKDVVEQMSAALGTTTDSEAKTEMYEYETVGGLCEGCS